MTFQNIFSSMADFRAVVSMLPCSPTNKGKKNLCGCAEKVNRQWAFVAFWLSSYVSIKTAAAFANWMAPKKDELFGLIYFFVSFCIYYIPHNYVIPQAMPHAIRQTHSAFYPHLVEKVKQTSKMRRREMQQHFKKACTFWHTGYPMYSCVLVMIYRTEL